MANKRHGVLPGTWPRRVSEGRAAFSSYKTFMLRSYGLCSNLAAPTERPNLESQFQILQKYINHKLAE